MLLQSTSFREKLSYGRCLLDSREEIDNNSMQMNRLVVSWISTSQSTEHMLRGPVIKTAGITGQHKREFMAQVHQVGILGIVGRNWLACSSDRSGLKMFEFQSTLVLKCIS